MYIHKGAENSNTEEKKPKDDVNYVHHHRLLIRSYVRTYVHSYVLHLRTYIHTYISLPYLLYTHLGIEEQSHARGWPRSQAVHKLV